MNELYLTRGRRMASFLSRELPNCFFSVNITMMLLYVMSSTFVGILRTEIGLYIFIPYLCFMLVAFAFKSKILRIALFIVISALAVSIASYLYVLEFIAFGMGLGLVLIHYIDVVFYRADPFKTAEENHYVKINGITSLNCVFAFAMSFFPDFKHMGFMYLFALASVVSNIIFLAIERTNAHINSLEHRILDRSLISLVVKLNNRVTFAVTVALIALSAVFFAVDYSGMQPVLTTIADFWPDEVTSIENPEDQVFDMSGEDSYEILGKRPVEHIYDYVFDSNTDPVEIWIIVALAAFVLMVFVVSLSNILRKNKKRPAGTVAMPERIVSEEVKPRKLRIPAVFLSLNEQVRRMFYDKVREHSADKHKIIVLPSSTSVSIKDGMKKLEDITNLEEAYRHVRYSGKDISKETFRLLKKGV